MKRESIQGQDVSIFNVFYKASMECRFPMYPDLTKHFTGRIQLKDDWTPIKLTKDPPFKFRFPWATIVVDLDKNTREINVYSESQRVISTRVNLSICIVGKEEKTLTMNVIQPASSDKAKGTSLQVPEGSLWNADLL